MNVEYIIRVMRDFSDGKIVNQSKDHQILDKHHKDTKFSYCPKSPTLRRKESLYWSIVFVEPNIDTVKSSHNGLQGTG